MQNEEGKTRCFADADENEPQGYRVSSTIFLSTLSQSVERLLGTP